MLKKELEQEIERLERDDMDQESRNSRLLTKLDKATKSIGLLKAEIVVQKARADRAEGYADRVREAEQPEQRRRMERRNERPHPPPNLANRGRTGWVEDGPETTPWYAL